MHGVGSVLSGRRRAPSRSGVRWRRAAATSVVIPVLHLPERFLEYDLTNILAHLQTETYDCALATWIEVHSSHGYARGQVTRDFA